MDNKFINPSDLSNGQQPDQKKPYHAPKIQRYGSLAELVQLRPDRGRDGETRWIDCTSGP
ncbi:MAG: hypothetical protein ABW019_15430 [Chitinophagaceae bacterium]